MLMLDERLFVQDWFVDLTVDERYMFLYLLSIASKKTGIFELNMRMINFGANTEKRFTREDILTKYGGRIQVVPGHENTAIFPAYIKTNWAKGAKQIDCSRNPLFKSIVAELARYDLTIEMVNEMTDKKIEVINHDGTDTDTDSDVSDVGRLTVDYEPMFAEFWSKYPGPRKQDKRKCNSKYVKILKASKDPNATHNAILEGIERWRKTDTWAKDNGQYICAPLVWLNNERWEAEIIEGGKNARSKEVATANNNYRLEGVSGLF